MWAGIGIGLGLVGIALGLARALRRAIRVAPSPAELLSLYSVAAGAAAIALGVALLETGLVLTGEMMWSIAALSGSAVLAGLLGLLPDRKQPGSLRRRRHWS